MSRDERKGPRLSEQGARERAARQARQAQALRENLLRRKAQARGRASEAAEGGAPTPGADDAPDG